MVNQKLRVGCILARKSTGFRHGGFQYGNFRISVRIPNFAMSRMSPRESHVLAVHVVRWARNLHIYNSTHQDLTFHRECLLISTFAMPYPCPVWKLFRGDVPERGPLRSGSYCGAALYRRYLMVPTSAQLGVRPARKDGVHPALCNTPPP